jgi:RNA ligase
MFPVIQHLDDVYDHFVGRPEFAIMDKGDYTVIDYVYADTDTFANEILLEGRGLKFDRHGSLIGRPFHKFFNLGEKPHTMPDALDWSQPVVVETKHDGSMIHPVLLNGQIVPMTRKGDTEVALQAFDECDVPYEEMHRYLVNGFTPIYEFVSPANQIVVPYEKPELRLLAVRHIITGTYVGHAGHKNTREILDGDFCRDSFVSKIRDLKGEEGVVLVWPNGHRVKIKAEEYVALHRNIDTAASESRLLEVILSGNLDDLIPLLSEARAAWVREFADQVLAAIAVETDAMDDTVIRWADKPQKDFAMFVNSHVKAPLRAAYFRHRMDGGCPKQLMLDRYSQVLRKQKDVDQYRDMLLNGATLERGGL